MSFTVVCPLSIYPSAERGLATAFDAAELLGGSLELFSAVEDPHMVGRRRSYLEEVGARHRPAGTDVPTLKVVVDPHAPQAIAARSSASDVVTSMASSTRPLLHTGYLGSAAEVVVRSAHNPALIVGPHLTTRLRDVQRVVVPCDGSKLSERVLPDAADWAKRLGVRLWVTTSLSPRDLRQEGFSATAEANYVRSVAERFDAEWEVLHGGDPAQAIVHWAGDALIAITTHGRSGLSRFTVGSVTTAITRWAKGPVLVANSHDAASSKLKQAS